MKMINKKLIVVLAFSGLVVGNSVARENSREIRALYKQLLTLQTSVPQQNTQKESSRAMSTNWVVIFEAAATTGLIKQYKDFWTESGNRLVDSIPEEMFGRFITPGNLQWTAYLQNKDSVNGNPFSYEPKVAVNGTWDNPVLGTYNAPGDKTIVITRYGFLEGLLSAHDQLTDQEWAQFGMTIEYRIKKLKAALNEAIKNSLIKRGM